MNYWFINTYYARSVMFKRSISLFELKVSPSKPLFLQRACSVVRAVYTFTVFKNYNARLRDFREDWTSNWHYINTKALRKLGGNYCGRWKEINLIVQFARLPMIWKTFTSFKVTIAGDKSDCSERKCIVAVNLQLYLGIKSRRSLLAWH